MGIFQRLFASRRRADAATLAAWQNQLDRVSALMDEFGFAEASSILLDALARLRCHPGNQAGHFRAAMLGALGECHFQSGDPERAVLATSDALRQPNLPPDLERSLRGNLYEIHRYLAQPDEAASQTDRLASLVEADNPVEAARYRRQAALVRAGEPPCRVVVDVAGQRLELDEVLAGQPGRLSFLIERNRLTLRWARRFLEMANEEGNAGRFEDALSYCLAAARADRFAPQPPYQAGLMLLHLEKPGEALASLRQCEDLAPDWPVQSALDIARLRTEGRIPHAVFVHWHALEEAPLPPEVKIHLAEQALVHAPWLPHLHHLRGKNLRQRNLAFAADKAYRRALELAPPPDLETRLCVDLAAVVDDSGEKRRLLQRAIDIGADLVATATARIVLHFD